MTNQASLKFLVGVSAVLIIGGCDSVSDGPTAVSKAEAPAVTKVVAVEASTQEKTICKVQPVTGSNLTKKKCATESEWARIREQSKQTTGWMQNAPGSLPRNGVAGG